MEIAETGFKNSRYKRVYDIRDMLPVWLLDSGMLGYFIRCQCYLLHFPSFEREFWRK
jgi:hypothetical protein